MTLRIVKCPHCKQQLRVDMDADGAVRCPGCQTVLRLPPRVELAAEGAKPRRRSPVRNAVMLLGSLAAIAVSVWLVVRTMRSSSPDEIGAAQTLREARRSALMGQWQNTKEALDRMLEQYKHTDAFARNAAEIAKLRQEARQHLRGGHATERAATDGVGDAPKGDRGPMVRRKTATVDTAFAKGDLAPWRADGGRWKVDGRAVTGWSDVTGLLVVPERRFDDFVFEADVTHLKRRSGANYGGVIHTGRQGIVFRHAGRYRLVFAITEFEFAGLNTEVFTGEWRDSKIPGVKILFGRYSPKLEAGSRHRLRAECAGTHVRLYLDDQLLAQGTDETLLTGRLGLLVDGAEAKFENIRVGPPLESAKDDPKDLAGLWIDRARQFEADVHQPLATKLEAWEDVLSRCPRADRALSDWMRSRRDHWSKAVHETLGRRTASARGLERRVFSAPVRELADGRVRVAYDVAAAEHLYDWERGTGFYEASPDGHLTVPLRARVPSTLCWNFSHGTDVRLTFDADTQHTHTFTLFGFAGDPEATGVQLSSGAGGFPAVTLGQAGQKPWFEEGYKPFDRQHRHEIEVAGGLLVYRREGVEQFRRALDVAGLRGRRLLLGSQIVSSRRYAPAVIDNIQIVTAPQPDWVPCHSGPAARQPLVPDPDGWLGMAHPDDGKYKMLTRGASIVSWADVGLFNHGRRFGWICSTATGAKLRDCVATARVEFLPATRGWDSSVGLIFRRRDRGEYVASLFGNGLATVRRRRRDAKDRLDVDDLATEHLFSPPRGVLRLVGVVQGRRLELYCNNRLLVTCDSLEAGDGAVGFEVEKTTAILHDFKFRPLPSDPLFDKLYGRRPR